PRYGPLSRPRESTGPLPLSSSGECPCSAFRSEALGVKIGNIMKSIPHGRPILSVQMASILESAVVLSWEDLVHASQRGPLHIDYVPATRLPYLKIRQLTEEGNGSWFVNIGCHEG